MLTMKKFVLVKVMIIGTMIWSQGIAGSIQSGVENRTGEYREICGSCINGRQFCRVFLGNRLLFRYWVSCPIEPYPPVFLGMIEIQDMRVLSAAQHSTTLIASSGDTK